MSTSTRALTTAEDVTPVRRRFGRKPEEEQDRSIISSAERRRRSVRIGSTIAAVLVLAFLCVIAAGPIVWLAKSAISTSQDILRAPLGWWPSGVQWQNLSDAWNGMGIGRALLNTVILAAGSWFFGLTVALTAGYVIAVLRPRYARLISGAVLATLFIPNVVSLVSLYVTVVEVPLVGVNLINTFWAVWLPAAASAFNVLLVQNFFASLPREIFEAAKVDGANSFDVFWRIVLPMSKPIIGVVSLLTIVAAWKEFLWPLLTLPAVDMQPLSVALYKSSATAGLSTLIAGMFISVIVPLVLFMIFQKQFLRSAGQSGAVKG